MTHEMRERLAERLYTVSVAWLERDVPGNADGYDWATDAPEVRDEYYLLADECIRQMEWARRCCAGSGRLELTWEPGELQPRAFAVFDANGKKIGPLAEAWFPPLTPADDRWVPTRAGGKLSPRVKAGSSLRGKKK